MQNCPRFWFCCAIGLASGIVTTAHANLIVSDSFEDKAIGALNGQGGGTNHSGTWTANYVANAAATVASASLSYTSGTVSVNGGSKAAQISNLASAIDNVINRSFTAQTGTIYFSMLFRPGQTPDTGAAGDFVQFLLNDDTDLDHAGSIGMGRAASPDRNPFFARVRTGSTDTTVLSSTNAMLQTYFLVGRYVRNQSNNYGTMALWVNPISDVEASNPVTITAAANSVVNSLSYFTVRTADLVNDTYFFDELRIGTTFASVVPVPEPATVSLIVAGLMWMIRRRRA